MHVTGVVSSATAFRGHATDGVIPEIPARAATIHDALFNADSDLSFARNLRAVPLVAAERAHLLRVHSEEYLDALERAGAGDSFLVSGDNPFLDDTVMTAKLAAGSVIAAVDEVMAGRLTNAFCAVRPPGHHAFPDHWEGFCYLNNIAIAARHLLHHHKLQRVLILDWDLHHGNGSQAAFYDEPRVLVVNLHGDPKGIYPGRSGFSHERGEGAGKGFNLNVPLPRGSGDELMRERFAKEIRPLIDSFAPEFVLISAGFDAHQDDPFQYLRWSDEAYQWLTHQTLEIARRFSQQRYVSVLEGGYSLEVLRRVVPLHVARLAAGTHEFGEL